MRSLWNRSPVASSRRAFSAECATHARRAVRGRAALLCMVAGCALSSILLPATAARAESMDFAIERLVTNAEACRTEGGLAGTEVCQPDNVAFAQLINQYGMAFAPTNMYSAHTTGYGGFEISAEANYTLVDGNADYMKRGTRGTSDPTGGRVAMMNESPASLLQLYSLRIRKGFGFGIETGLQFGVMPGTSMISGGADLRLALFEGFRSGIPGYIPDVAVVGSVRTITGTPQVQLTVASVGAILSKQISVVDAHVLTPALGFQYLWIFGDSGVVDFTPKESALSACGYTGPDVPGNPGMSSHPDGSPVCEEGGSVSDFNNNRVFDPVRLQRMRLNFGLNYRYEVLTVGAHVMADVFNSAVTLNGKETDEDGDNIFRAEKDDGGKLGNFAFAFQLGAVF